MAASKRDILRGVRIFAGLHDNECDAIVRVIKARRGAPGDVLFRQGDPASSMIIVAEGKLGARITLDGQHEAEIAQFGPSEVVGEMALIDPAPRSATIFAKTPALIYVFEREAFERLRSESPIAAAALVRGVMKDVARRLRDVNEQIEKQLDGAFAKVARQSIPVSANDDDEVDVEDGFFGALVNRVRGAG